MTDTTLPTVIPNGAESHYWLDERRGYVPLSEFPPFLLAIRDAGAPGWARQHPRALTVDERRRDIVEELTGAPAYLADHETSAAAQAQAESEAVDA